MNTDLTVSGRTAVAKLISDAPLWLAWGKGDADWTASDFENLDAETALTDELARRRCNIIGFVEPADDGDIHVQLSSTTAKYSRVTAPSPHLYVQVSFDADDDVGETIREIGLFINTTIDSSLHAATRYVTPDQLEDAGTLLTVARLAVPIVVTGDTRQTFDFVLPILE